MADQKHFPNTTFARGVRRVGAFINDQFSQLQSNLRFQTGSDFAINDGRFNVPLQGPIHQVTSFRSMSRKRKRSSSRRGKRQMSGMSIARKALSKVRKLERKVEVKTFDVGLNTIVDVAVAVGSITNLALIGQGDLSTQRDGDGIAPFFFRMNWNWTGPIAFRSGIMRMIIFRDTHQVDGGAPTILNVLTSVTPLSLYNRLLRKRWKVLFDRTFTATQSSSDAFMAVGQMNLRLKLKMRFNGVAGANILENGLYMILVSNVAADKPSFTFQSRVFFNDS